MERRSFTPEFKADAVARALQPGANKLGLARDLDISNNVLHRWIRQSGQSASPEVGENGVRRKGRPRIVRTPQADGAGATAGAAPAGDRVARTESSSVVSAKRRGAAAPKAVGRPSHSQQMGLPEVEQQDAHSQGNTAHTDDTAPRGRGRPRLADTTHEASGGQHEDLASLRQNLERVSQERDMLRQMLGHYFAISQ